MATTASSAISRSTRIHATLGGTCSGTTVRGSTVTGSTGQATIATDTSCTDSTITAETPAASTDTKDLRHRLVRRPVDGRAPCLRAARATSGTRTYGDTPTEALTGTSGRAPCPATQATGHTLAGGAYRMSLVTVVAIATNGDLGRDRSMGTRGVFGAGSVVGAAMRTAGAAVTRPPRTRRRTALRVLSI